MKKMATIAMAALMVISAGTAAFAGGACCGKAKTEKKAAYCPKCGEANGSENCCKEGVENCAECGLHKGSAGCKAKCADS